jgi:hypothetical protein
VTEKEAEANQEPGKSGGCLRRLGQLALVGLVLLAGLLVWLNGPGMRWLGPKVAGHYLEKAGLVGSLRLGGTLLGGVKIYDLEITGREGALERVVVDRLETDYRFTEVIKGKIRGISGEGVHVDLRMVPSEKEEKPPMDFAALGRTLNGVREKIMPLDLDLEDVSLSVKKDGELMVGLGDSSFSHKPGEDEFALKLGMVTDAAGRTLRPQDVEMVWEKGLLSLGRLDLLPIVGVRDLEVLLPEDGEISANANIRLNGAILKLDVGRGIRDVRLDMTEGELNFGNALGGIGIGPPLKGKVTSLALEMRQVFPEWQKAVGTAELFVEGFSYDGWAVPEVSVGIVLDDGELSAKLAGKSMGSNFSMDGKGEFERSAIAEGKFGLGRIGGKLEVDQLGEVLRALDAKLDLEALDFTGFPASDIGGEWAVELGAEGFGGASVDVVMAAKEAEASPIRLDAAFKNGVVTVNELGADGLEFSGTYVVEGQIYEARQVLENFDSARIAPWLEGMGIESPGSGVVSMKWEGSGILADNTMRGELTGLQGRWIMEAPEGGEARPPVSAKAERISYNWPGTAEFEGLVLGTQGQTVILDGELRDNEFTLENFLWSEGEDELAQGSGTLPMPEDFTKFNEFLANDTRPLDLSLNSETLPLAKLRPWVKGLEQIDEKATGKVELKIGGNLAEPEVDALVEVRDVSVPGKGQIPTTDVTVNISARNGLAAISAVAVAPDYAPATLNAEMDFLPKKWAENPESLFAEEIKGTLDLPRIDLSRFQSLIPGAEEFGGVATGKVLIAGTVGEPVVDGGLKLSGGKLRMEGDTIPALSGIDFDVNANLKTVEIKGRVGDLEGGNITIDGKMEITNETGDGPGPMDVSVKGTGMPVMRNEYLIMRANADLQIRGTMAEARVTGEVGIIDSVFYRDMELIPIGKPFLEPQAAALPSVTTPDNPAAAVPAPFREWTADVVLKTIDPILVRGNLGKGQVDVALRIEGKLGDPKPNGKVRLTDAVARLPFSTLEVRRAFLTFTPQTGFDPIVELRGTAEPRPYRVDVYAHGRMSDPQLVLTSQPPLPENEIMTLLATGTTSAGLEDSQAASSRAMQLLIEELRRGRFLFGKQLRPVLGLLDNVDFSLAESDPYDSGTYNSATLKLSDRWYVSAGIGEEGDQRVLAIWRLRFR